MITGNTHFAIATHVLAALALHRDHLVTSSELAVSVATNPAFLRAVMGRLRDAELLVTKLGKGGGSTLARPADQISLLDVFRATDGTARIGIHDCGGSNCPVGRKMPSVLHRLEQTLDQALARELSAVHISDIAADLQV